MSEEQKNKSAKKPRRKPTDLGKYDMENIRYLGNDYYTVAVKRRVNGRLITKRARRVKGRQNAINTRREFLKNLSILQYSKGAMKEPQWRDAREGYVEALKRRVEIGEIGEGEAKKINGYLSKTKSWDTIWASQITEDMVMEIKYGRMGAEKLSQSGRKDYLRAVKGVFNWLMKNRRIFVNPAAEVYIRKPRPNPVQWIRPEWFEKLMKKVKGTYWEPVFFLAYYSGLRSGELYALKWSDIDFEEGILHVNHSYSWSLKREKLPKSGQARMVDISAPELKDFLLRHREKNIKNEATYVFSRNDEWEAGKAARAVASALDAIKFPAREEAQTIETIDEHGNVTTEKRKVKVYPNFHSLRASFTMNLLLNETPILIVQKVLGHLDLKSTQHYLGELKKSDIIGTSEVLFGRSKKKQGKLKIA